MFLFIGLALLAGACAESIDSPNATFSTRSLSDWDGCLTTERAVVARLSPSRIRFCGRINADAVEAFTQMLAPTDTTLEITSLGGELDSPITLAELVVERQLDIEVIGPCLSGCASYVFVAGVHRRVRNHGWLGLHNTNSSAALVAESARGRALDEADAPLLLRVEMERQLYESLGISLQLLLEPQVRIRTRCITAAWRNASTGETEYRILSQATFWMPTKDQWRSYGVEFEGYSPESSREATRIAEATLPISARENLEIEYSPASLTVPPELTLAQLAWCTTSSIR